MDHLFWANSVLAHPARVLVIEERYQSEHALSLFQMGVDEYVGVSEHADQLRTILEGMLEETKAQSVRSGQPVVSQAPRPVQEPLSQPVHWVAASSA